MSNAGSRAERERSSSLDQKALLLLALGEGHHASGCQSARPPRLHACSWAAWSARQRASLPHRALASTAPSSGTWCQPSAPLGRWSPGPRPSEAALPTLGKRSVTIVISGLQIPPRSPLPRVQSYVYAYKVGPKYPEFALRTPDLALFAYNRHPALTLLPQIRPSAGFFAYNRKSTLTI